MLDISNNYTVTIINIVHYNIDIILLSEIGIVVILTVFILLYPTITFHHPKTVAV